MTSLLHPLLYCIFFFFFNDTATTEIYTLSLHDALPIWSRARALRPAGACQGGIRGVSAPLSARRGRRARDRKSTRLNSSHLVISYAVFCLKKKKYITYNATLSFHPTSSQSFNSLPLTAD